MFTDDNSDYLPPGAGSMGLEGGVHTAYTTTPSSTINGTHPEYQLATYIYRYLALPEPGPQIVLAQTLICPGFQNLQNTGDISSNICYVVSQGGIQSANGSIPNNNTWWVFGYENRGGPHKIAELPAEAGLPLSSIWMLADVDQVVIPISSGNGWAWQLPRKPAHVLVRNFAYFDGHVSAKHVGPTGWFYNPKFGPE
jgi:prepilin-type processing-associated H-X9-DG protein